jgi:hypothetical protein
MPYKDDPDQRRDRRDDCSGGGRQRPWKDSRSGAYRQDPYYVNERDNAAVPYTGDSSAAGPFYNRERVFRPDPCRDCSDYADEEQEFVNADNEIDSFRKEKKNMYDRSDCQECRAKHPKPKPVILECGTGGGFAFATNGTDICLTNPCTACKPKTVGTVTIDTTCLCKPKTKVDFCCNILYDGRSNCSNLKLEFQLFRTCDFRAEEPLGSWYFQLEDQDDDFAQSFCLSFCDCSGCPACCVYTVRVIPLEVKDATFSVNNCHISAIAQGNCD